MAIFEWDEAKDAANQAKHGVSFAQVQGIFDNPVFTVVDARFDYGEVRRISIGTTDGQFFLTVVHTDRAGRIRIISARRASRRERRDYEQAIRKQGGA
jgi:uncharacterized protein